MEELIDRIARQLENASADHKAQAGLLTGSQGNFSGFIGYWTNYFFNSDIPPPQIWNNCASEIAHARSTLREGNLVEFG